jgi:outer membrane immunogenic protein
MRLAVLVGLMFFATVTTTVAQEGISGDFAATYHWVHTNAGPGECGCFGLDGVGVSASWNFRGRLSAVAEVGAEFTSNVPITGNSLTLVSYLGGVRYQLPRLSHSWLHSAHGVQPFAQALIGTAHAGGGVAGLGDGTYGFASRLGGGIDIPLSRRFPARIQADYYLTHFANGVNDHQNNLLIGAGVVYHW